MLLRFQKSIGRRDKNESGELCGNTPSTHAKTRIVGAYRFLPHKISPFRFKGICLEALARYQYVLQFYVMKSGTKSSAFYYRSR